MRSHAKASSVGTTRRQASGLRFPAGVLIAILALLGLMASSASAVKTHVFKEAFGSAAQPSFGGDTGLAIDQSSGALLVIDSQADTVSRFNPDGTPANFSALGSNVIDGKGTADLTPQNGLTLDGAGEVQIAVDNSAGATAGNIYVTQSSLDLIDIFDSTGAYIGQLTGDGVNPFGEPCGVAVDSAGAVYVGDYSSGVHKFVPAANPPVNTDHKATFTHPSTCTVAAGAGPSAGFVFAAKYQGEVSKLNSTTGAVQYGIAGNHRTVSVDPATGHLYAIEFNIVNEYDVSGASSANLVSSLLLGTTEGAAVRGSTGNVYISIGASPNTQVYGPLVSLPDVVTGKASNRTKAGATLNGKVNPEGVELQECKFEYGPTNSYGQSVPCAESPAAIGTGLSQVSVHADVSGLSGSSKYHFRLAARNENSPTPTKGADESFFTLGPLLSGLSASGIGANAATLKALVNPNSEFTSYHFEYGDQGPCDSNPCTSKPVPDGSVGGGSEDVPVSTSLIGLQPDTTYHFRLVATNLSSPVGGTASPDAAFTTFPSTPTFSCPNDEFRTGPGARLPDCRAYEQASPVDKNGADVSGDYNQFKVSSNGDAVAFFTNGGLPGGVGSQDFPFYLASRGDDNWSTQGLLPPPSYGVRARVNGWTPDLKYTFSSTVTPGGPALPSFLVRSSADGSIASVFDGPDGFEFPNLAGVSADGSTVFFETTQKLTPEAPPGVNNLYAWERSTDAVSLVGVLPDSACGTPPCAPAEGSIAGPYSWFSSSSDVNSGLGGNLQEEHVISTDGDHAFFTESGTAQLYVRKNAGDPGATTSHVSASQRSAPDPNGPKPAALVQATPSGAVAFFLSCEKLTDDSTAFSSTPANTCHPEERGIEGADLYAYETSSGDLTDLTVDDSGNPKGADVKGVIGASDDGAYVYFAANGDLDGSGKATLGDCTYNTVGHIGSCNLYLSHAGTVTFIAHIDSKNIPSSQQYATAGGVSNWKPTHISLSESQKTGRVSLDGRTLLFETQTELTPNAEGLQIYRYDVSEGLLCITCDPTGNRAGGGDLQSVRVTSQIGPESKAQTLTRNLSADGNRVFFETPAKLVAADINGDVECPEFGYWRHPRCQDVYEWEASGTGSCQSTAQNGGCLYLLSTGTGTQPSYFGDASMSGDDVFIFTRDTLVPQDGDGDRDIYDVRVGGGLASQYAVQPPICTGDACRGAGSSAPPQQGAGTAVFSGAGDPAVKRRRPKSAVTRNAIRGNAVTEKRRGEPTPAAEIPSDPPQEHPPRRFDCDQGDRSDDGADSLFQLQSQTHQEGERRGGIDRHDRGAARARRCRPGETGLEAHHCFQSDQLPTELHAEISESPSVHDCRHQHRRHGHHGTIHDDGHFAGRPHPERLRMRNLWTDCHLRRRRNGAAGGIPALQHSR